MTTLEITPRISDKTARFRGTVAAGEHVAVTIKGGAEWLGDDAGANLTLRVLDLVTGRTLAVFPRPAETLDDGDEPDEWGTSAEDPNDLFCNLNLNTTRMVDAARHMLRVPVLFVLGDTDAPRTLYFRDRHEVEFWPERVGDDTPYDLDKWPKQIDEWVEQVAAWSTRMDNLALDAERVNGGVKITLNDGTLETPKEVVVNDGEVSLATMNAAIAAMGSTKQNTLTFDAIPTEGSDNPVKSGGVHGAVKKVADAVAEHVGNTGIHVTAEQKTAWTAKYVKPQDGIPKSDLAAGVQASLGRADTAIQTHQSLDAYVNAAGYDSTAKEIQLKHDSTVVARIDATAFIKDGMVDSVEIIGGNLVISFNTDAGIEDIEIPLTDIFNPANYYDKTAADGRYVQKETGKGLVAVDASLTTPGAAADAKATGTALFTGFTEWEFSGVEEDIPEGTELSMSYDESSARWVLTTTLEGQVAYNYKSGAPDDLSVTFDLFGTPFITATRHLVTPTKTSQLMNDSGFLTSHQDISGKLDSIAAYPVWQASGQGYWPAGTVVSWKGRLYKTVEGTAFPVEPGTPEAVGEWTEITIWSLLAAKQDALSSAQLANIAAVPNKANSADVATAIAGVRADLPYALVTPGEWEFSDGGSYAVIGPIDGSDGWYYQISPQVGSQYNSQSWNTELKALAALSLTFDSDPEITATRPSLPGHLLDRAGNRVEVSGDTTLTLPAAVPGYIRDFLVRLEISGSTVPTITFAAPTGETITYETDGDEFPVPDEAGNWLYSFTETAAHTFAVSLKKVNAVTQGGS